MKKSLLMIFCASAVAFSACTQSEKTETTTATTTDSYADNADSEATYRQQASQVSRKMASDLQLENDMETQNKAEEIYVNRARRAAEIRQRHTADTSGMYAELREINLETDREFETMLTPDQLKLYQTNRTTYYRELDEMPTASNLGASGTQLSPDAEIKTKTDKDGDTKTKIKDGNTEIKIKRDADGETKIKTSTKN